MKATRVFIPEQVEATGRYISALLGVPLADVYTVLLTLAVDNMDPSTLAAEVQARLTPAAPPADTNRQGKLPF